MCGHAANSTTVERNSQQVCIADLRLPSKLHSMNRGKRIKRELDERMIKTFA